MLNLTDDYVLDRAAEQAHTQYLLDCFMGRDTYKKQRCYTPECKRDIVDKAPKPLTPDQWEQREKNREGRRERRNKKLRKSKNKFELVERQIENAKNTHKKVGNHSWKGGCIMCKVLILLVFVGLVNAQHQDSDKHKILYESVKKCDGCTVVFNRDDHLSKVYKNVEIVYKVYNKTTYKNEYWIYCIGNGIPYELNHVWTIEQY